MAFSHRGYLPPRSASCPYARRVGSDNGRPEASNATIHVTVAVRSNCNCARPCVSLFYHQLMPDALSGAEKPYPLLLGEGLDLLVFLKIRFALVLDVVVEGEHHLARVVDLRSANGHKL